MVEEWKWIEGYEGIYKISNFGRIRSYKQKSDGYVRSNVNQTGWYFTVVLKDKNGVNTTKRIHRLVAEAFIKKIPEGYHVHHIDGDKQNNRVDNLEIINAHDHLSKTMKEHPEYCDGMKHRNQYLKPLTIYMYSDTGDYLASFPNAKCASVVTGVCWRNILQVANKDEYSPGRVRKQAGGYVWSFDPPEGGGKNNAH